MNIVKLYFKIVYDKKTSILTYLVIFTVVFGLFTAYMQTNNSMPDAYESVKTNIAFIDPVSYTHLDVYKRQLL